MNKEYEVLGYKVKFRPAEESQITAREVIKLVETEIRTIREAQPTLDNGQIAILAALKLAFDKILQEKELKNQVQDIQKFAEDALGLIEEVSPTVQ